MNAQGLEKGLRYVISGGSAAVVNLGTLYVLAHILHVWYLASSVAAFVLSFFVSFALQRTWTFEVRGRRALASHSALYLTTVLVNLAINTGIVYLLVEYLHLGPVAAQFVAGVFISFQSFFLYRRIFRI